MGNAEVNTDVFLRLGQINPPHPDGTPPNMNQILQGHGTHTILTGKTGLAGSWNLELGGGTLTNKH